MKNLLFLMVAYLLCGQINAQDYCNQIWTENLYTSIERTEFVYDSTANGDPLELEIFNATDNTVTEKPLFVLLHGGSYVGGSKEEMVELALYMAAKGFLVASIEYTIWSFAKDGFPTATGILDVAIQSIYDLNSAIDFLLVKNNVGGIASFDPSNIVIGGVSAGAITCLHRMYLDATDSTTNVISGIIDGKGGLFTKESEEYNIVAGINLSGAVLDSSWLKGETTPLFSIHGDSDETVPYQSGYVNGILLMYGSAAINENLIEQGVPSYLYTFEGGGHTDIYTQVLYRNQLFTVLDTIVSGLQDQICLRTSAQSLAPVEPFRLVNTLVQDRLILEHVGQEARRYEVIDLQGKVIQQGLISPFQNSIEVQNLKMASYVFRTKNIVSGYVNSTLFLSRPQ